MICLGFTRICREIVDDAIYALYPESFCSEILLSGKFLLFLTLAMSHFIMFLKISFLIDYSDYASALASAYLLFKDSDPSYAATLLGDHDKACR